MVSVEDAIAAVLVRTAPLPPESVPLAGALGLVLAADVHAAAPQPPFPAAVVHGAAVVAADGNLPRRLAGEQMAGRVAGVQVQPGTAVRITTGAPIPPRRRCGRHGGARRRDGRLGDAAQRGFGRVCRSRSARTCRQAKWCWQKTGRWAPLSLACWLRSAWPSCRSIAGRWWRFLHRRRAGYPGNPLALGQIYDSNRPTLLAAVAQAGGKPPTLHRARPADEGRQISPAAWPKLMCW